MRNDQRDGSRPGRISAVATESQPSELEWWWRWPLPPLALFLGIAVVLFAWMSLFAYPHVPHWFPGVKPPHFHGPRWLEPWARFDAGWYRDIAEHGYYYRGNRAQSSVPFFPLYPLTIRALHGLFGGNTVTWGIPITFVSGLTVVLLFYRWCSARFSRGLSLFACALLCLWPYAFFLYGTVYADALFIALALAAFSFLEADHPALAGVAGGLAALTRPVGAAVVLGLIAVAYERGRGAPAGRDYRRDSWVLISLVGLAAYPMFLWWKFGNPFAFAVAEGAPGWWQGSGPKTWFKYEYFKRVIYIYKLGILYPINLTLQLVVAIALLVAVVKARRSIGYGYLVYAVAVLAIALIGTKDFQGLGRYTLATFPAFAGLAQLLSRRTLVLRVATVVGLVVLIGVLSSAYARWSYVS